MIFKSNAILIPVLETLSQSLGILSHLGVSLEAASGLAGSQIPQTQSLIPGTGQSVVTVGRQHNVADEVRVSVQTLLGVAVVGILITGQLPDNQSLVYERREILKYLFTNI